MREGCACKSCRLEAAVFSVIAVPDDATPGAFSISVQESLPAMIPIMGVMLAALDPAELEPTWRLLLDARSRALDRGADAIGSVSGRA